MQYGAVVADLSQRALFDAARVPGQVEVEQVRAMGLEVQAFAGGVRGQEDA